MQRFQKAEPKRKNQSIAWFILSLSALYALPNYGFAQLNERPCVPIHIETYIGVREEGGANAGKMVERFLATTGLGKGYPWCAAFVATILTECQVPNPKSAWSPAYFPTSKVIYIRGSKQVHLKVNTPVKGDVFGLYFPSKGRIAHVGFIDEWTASKVITIEGNTNEAGSREGDGVYRKRRLTRQIYQVARWTK